MTGTVLLTGATGFVGRQVLYALVERKVPVKLVIRPVSIEKLKGEYHYEIIYSEDLFSESIDWWSRVCENVDIVIHVAWYAEPGKYLQSIKNLDCLVGTINLAQGAIDANVKRFVGIGTCFEYDLKGGVVSINTSLNPLTPYAGAKAAAFFSLSNIFSKKELEFAWCRLFYLYGEGENSSRLVPYIRSRISANQIVELTSGIQIRDYLDVKIAGERITEIALSSLRGAVNVCSGIPITVRQFAENIADEYNRRDLLRYGVRPDNYFDPLCVVGIKGKDSR